MSITVDFRKIYVYVVLFLIAYTSGFIYNIVYYSYDNLFKWIVFFAAGVTIFFIDSVSLAKIGKALLLGFVLLGFTVIGNGDMIDLIKIVTRIIAILSFFLYCNEREIPLLKYLCNMLCFFAVLFFVGWLLFSVGPMKDVGHQITVYSEVQEGIIRTHTYTSYYGIFYRWWDDRRLFGIDMMSNNGPFWEPGLYQIFLNFALWYKLYVEKRGKFWPIFLSVCVITTTSTMGVLILIAIISLKIIEKQKGITRVLFLIPSICLAAFSFYAVYLEKKVNYEANVLGRLGDMDRMISVFIEHPVFGGGIGSYIGSTNALVLYLVDFGLIGVIFLIFVINRILKRDDVIFSKLTLIVWLMLSLMNENIGYFNLTWLIYFCILSNVHYESNTMEFYKLSEI